MSTFPSLPLFTDAWVADTKHLSRLDRGTYLDLLVLMWRTPGCRVPNDDVWLSKRLGMTVEEVKNELRPLIREFAKSSGNWLTQKRLRKEWNWCKKNSKQRSGAAKSRWDKEKTKSKRNADTDTPRNAPNPILSPPTEEEANASSSRARTRATRLSEDWMPSEADGRYAVEKGLTKAEAQHEFEKFRNYWMAKSGNQATKVDWSMTWRNWILTTIERKGKPNGNGGRGGKQSLSELAFDLADEAREREREAGIGREDDAVRSH